MIKAEPLDEMETVTKRFEVTSDQLADLEVTAAAEILTITWQRVTDRAPSLLVTVPYGDDAWALPVPHRPEWLMTLIVKNAPAWWIK
ncbi:hypothetical protein [Streptomyces parvulus]|uniref:hypothetical protein n=1 Tax=Streptomyces parvulus TaxID=146923 RepID=UPI0037FDF447